VAERRSALRSIALRTSWRRGRALRALAFLALGAWAASGASATAGEPPAPIFVVRHAEKLDPDDADSPLSQAGSARARELAELLHARGVRTIVVSEKRRTRETAAPLAQRLGVEPTGIASEIHVGNSRVLAAEIAKRRERGAVLVVTHSNAIPGLICALTGRPVPDLGEDENDRLYTIDGAALSATTYGAAFSGARELRARACEARAP